MKKPTMSGSALLIKVQKEGFELYSKKLNECKKVTFTGLFNMRKRKEFNLCELKASLHANNKRESIIMENLSKISKDEKSSVIRYLNAIRYSKEKNKSRIKQLERELKESNCFITGDFIQENLE